MTNTTKTSPVTINVNGKDFIVHPPNISLGSDIGAAHYTYFSTRDGKKFGPIRTASETGGVKTVGRQLAVAARAHFGEDAIAEARAAAIDSLRRQIANVDPTSKWADSHRDFYGKQLAALEAFQAG